VQEFPRGLMMLACFVLASTAVWYGILRRGHQVRRDSPSSDLIAP